METGSKQVTSKMKQNFRDCRVYTRSNENNLTDFNIYDIISGVFDRCFYDAHIEVAEPTTSSTSQVLNVYSATESYQGRVRHTRFRFESKRNLNLTSSEKSVENQFL